MKKIGVPDRRSHSARVGQQSALSLNWSISISVKYTDRQHWTFWCFRVNDQTEMWAIMQSIACATFPWWRSSASKNCMHSYKQTQAQLLSLQTREASVRGNAWAKSGRRHDVSVSDFKRQLGGIAVVSTWGFSDVPCPALFNLFNLKPNPVRWSTCNVYVMWTVHTKLVGTEQLMQMACHTFQYLHIYSRRPACLRFSEFSFFCVRVIRKRRDKF